MDANGHRFWLFAAAEDFDLSDPRVLWSSERHSLRLSGRVRDEDVPLDRAAARAMSNLPPVAVDAFGTWAWPDTAAGGVLVAGALEQPEPILDLPAGVTVLDMIVDGEGVLHIAVEDTDGARSLWLADLRGRWLAPVVIETGDDGPDRLALGAGGPVWAINRHSAAVWTLAGRPLPDLAVHPYAATVFRPEHENAEPPRLVPRAPIKKGVNDTIVDCAARADGTLAVLVLRRNSIGRSRAVFLSPEFEQTTADLPGKGFPGSIGWVSEERLAALFPGLNRARVYRVPPVPIAETLSPDHAHFPITATASARSCHGATLPCNYVAWDGTGAPPGPRPLHSLSMPGYAISAVVPAARPIDSGVRGTVWHRVYLEASLPSGTGVTLRLAAAETPEDTAGAAFFEHVFGDGPPATEPDVP